MQKTKKEIMEGIDCIKSKKIDNNTIEYLQNNGTKVIRLHQTDIITFKNGVVILNSGGWRTPTTRNRINKYSGIHVNQLKGQWFIGEYLFYDGMKFKDGKLISKEIKNNLSKVDKR